MSTLTKDKAWAIFHAQKLGQPEAATAIDTLTEDEWNSYQSHCEEFEMKLAQIGIEAQNEGAAIWEAAGTGYLQHKKAWALTAHDYTLLVTPFKGSKFETLHLSALFGVNNAELLLELVKP